MSRTPFKTRPLGKTDCRVSEIGFGAASVGNLYQAVSDAQARATMAAAWDAGIRLYDTAPHYGQGLSERRVGDVLRDKNPSEYILSTKVGRLLKPAGYAPSRHGFCSPMPFDISYDYSYDGIMRSFEDSQQRLGLDRIDIVLVHDIGHVTHGTRDEFHFNSLVDSGYKALEGLRNSGQIRAIGLGVNEYQVCERALEHGDYDCFLLAGRYTLLEQETLDSFLPLCQQRGVTLLIGGAYNSGILATGTRTEKTPSYNYTAAPAEIISRVQKLEAVCDEFDVSLAAAALQFPLAHPVVSSVIPGLGSVSHIERTMGLFDEAIPDGFWRTLQQQGLVHSEAPVPGAGGL